MSCRSALRRSSFLGLLRTPHGLGHQLAGARTDDMDLCAGRTALSDVVRLALRGLFVRSLHVEIRVGAAVDEFRHDLLAIRPSLAPALMQIKPGACRSSIHHLRPACSAIPCKRTVSLPLAPPNRSHDFSRRRQPVVRRQAYAAGSPSPGKELAMSRRRSS